MNKIKLKWEVPNLDKSQSIISDCLRCCLYYIQDSKGV